MWSGDFPVDSLGEIYVKIRRCNATTRRTTTVVTTMGSSSSGGGSSKDLLIVQVKVELVKASVVVTFSEQDPQWPPYRIDNLTSYNIR